MIRIHNLKRTRGATEEECSSIEPVGGGIG